MMHDSLPKCKLLMQHIKARNNYTHVYSHTNNNILLLFCSYNHIIINTFFPLLVQWHIKQQPIDVLTKVGEDVKFFIVTSPGQVSYNWCFNDQSISDDNVDYRGARTRELVVLKSLSKHCGSYKCIVTHLDVHIPSIPASLEIGINNIKFI